MASQVRNTAPPVRLTEGPAGAVRLKTGCFAPRVIDGTGA
jgi:hypothetical protein